MSRSSLLREKSTRTDKRPRSLPKEIKCHDDQKPRRDVTRTSSLALGVAGQVALATGVSPQSWSPPSRKSSYILSADEDGLQFTVINEDRLQFATADSAFVDCADGGLDGVMLAPNNRLPRTRGASESHIEYDQDSNIKLKKQGLISKLIPGSITDAAKTAHNLGNSLHGDWPAMRDQLNVTLSAMQTASASVTSCCGFGSTDKSGVALPLALEAIQGAGNAIKDGLASADVRSTAHNMSKFTSTLVNIFDEQFMTIVKGLALTFIPGFLCMFLMLQYILFSNYFPTQGAISDIWYFLINIGFVSTIAVTAFAQFCVIIVVSYLVFYMYIKMYSNKS